MNVNIDWRIESSEPLKAYTLEKMERVHRHFDKIISIHVVFDTEKLNQVAEATIKLAGGTIHASSKTENMYNSVDDLVDKLDRQVKEHKERLRDHREK